MEDPLNVSVPTAGVDTTLPLLPEADYNVRCSESKVEPNKDKNGYNWNLKLETTEICTAVDGREVPPNFPVFVTCALQARPDSKDKQAFIRNLGDTMDALLGTNQETRPNFDRSVVDQAVGKTCIAHVFVDTYEGRQLNKVRRLKAVA